MLVHLRLVVPDDLTARVRRLLVDDDRVTNVVVDRGACVDPPGDIVEADVAREASNDILDDLEDLGLSSRGAITVTDLSATPFDGAERIERAAAGEADDSVIWDVVVEQADETARPSLTYFAFLVLATALAGVAVFTDSPILVVGAMVVGPDFGPVAAICTAVAMRKRRLLARGAALLVGGYAIAVLVVAGVAALGRLAGIVTPDLVTRPRPLTEFIWQPDVWALVVAVLAGAAGALAVTASKSNALVGVFISVTTVPAAGNLAVALATGVTAQVGGCLTQLGVNVAGMLVSGTLVLLLQRWLVGRYRLARTGIPR